MLSVFIRHGTQTPPPAGMRCARNLRARNIDLSVEEAFPPIISAGIGQPPME